jgi:capsular polysaccharide biosynthesis protein
MVFDRIKPAIYAFVKRNPRVRNMAMPLWQFILKAKEKTTTLVTGAEVLGPPVDIIDFDDAFVNGIGKDDLNAIVTFKPIAESKKVLRALPRTVEKTIHWKFMRKQTVMQPATYVMEIKDGRGYDDGVVITPGNKMLTGVSKFIEAGEYITDHSQHPIFSKKTLPPLKKMTGTVAVLSAPSGRGYYHWMFDVLPRIQLLLEAGYDFNRIDKFLINNYISRFHIETLNMIGVPRNKIIESQLNPHLQAETLIVPSLVGDTGSVPGYACNFLRNQFLPKISKNNNHSERIYVNRGQVGHRRVLNEPEIVSLLKQYGFESIALETLSLTDQIALMASAKVVIAPHGAGLTNIVFCDAGTKIIEFLYPAAVNVMYWTISEEMKFDYYYLMAEGEVPPENVNPYLNSDDMIINIEKLKDLLSLAGIK